MGAARLVARAPELPLLTELLAREGTLYDAACRRPRIAELRGRGAVPVVELAGTPCVVRHYQRGGAVAGVLGDRYARWSGNRVLAEVRVSEQARARAVPTPRVVCGAWYPHGLFLRYDIATEYIPASQDLSQLLLGDVAPAEPVLVATAQLIRVMVRAGLVHEDLNVKNIIVAGERAYVLDLDRCRLEDGPDAGAAQRMRARFFRSIDKWEALTGKRVPDAARAVLSRAFDA